MRNIKLIVIALILGLTAIVFTASAQQTSAPTDGKEKVVSCCTKSSESCCMKEHQSGDAQAAHKSCDMSKAAGCCDAKSDCCKPGADCCKAGAECCKASDSCCVHHEMSADEERKACDMKKDGKGCCATSECCTAKTAKH